MPQFLWYNRLISDMKNKSAVVVGCGIVGLLSAYFLHRAGLKVSVIDAGPNPLTNYDRAKAGATFSGADARHVSATETSPHASSSMHEQIYKGVREGGWLSKDPKLLTTEEKAWMKDFDHLTKEQEHFNMFTKTVVNVNNLGKDMWRKLTQEDPDLFKDCGMQEKITVFFLDQETFFSETDVETKANPDYPVKTLTLKEIIKEYPAMEEPINKGIIAGGLVLDGFAVQAISFCRNVIARMEREGVDFSWNNEVTNLEEIGKNFDYYLVSTGVSIAKKVMGVAGVWIKIPNSGFKNPFKIATPYPTGYINATLFENSLLLSGGYGFIGKDIRNEESQGIQTLFEDIKRNIKRVFPAIYQRALLDGTLDEKACVRPMKATGLGVFEVENKGKAKIIYVGANNAGGFTQAPVIAQSVLDVVNERESLLLKEYASDLSFFKR